MSYQNRSGPPNSKDDGGYKYNSAPSKSQGYANTPDFYTGPQGYPDALRPGFPIAGAQSPNVQPQGVPPPPRPFWSVDAIPVPKENDKGISYAGNVGDRSAVGLWGLPPIAQSYDHRQLHPHGGGIHGQARDDSSSSSHPAAVDMKSQATDEADHKHQRGYSKSNEKQWIEDPANSRDAHTSSHDSYAHGDKTSFSDSHSRGGDGKKNVRHKSDGDRKADKPTKLNLDVVLQNEHLTNLLYAGISKATAKLEQSLKNTDKKLENYASTDDSTSRHKAQQSAQASSADVPHKLKSILKRKTGEEKIDVESQVSTGSQVSSNSFSQLSALEKTLHLLLGKTDVEDVVRGSEKGGRGSEKLSYKPVGALSQLESYNDSGDDNDRAERDTKKQTKTSKNAPSTQPFWSKMDHLPQQTRQTHNLASSSQAKKTSDINEKELDSTVQNIMQSIGFNFDLSKRTQELAHQKEQEDVLHTGMINQSASFLRQSDGLVRGVRAALLSDKPKMALPDILIKQTAANMQKRPDYERSASGDTFSAETQSGKNSYSRKTENPEPDNGRSRMGLGSREIQSDRHLENIQNKDWEQISPDEDEMDGTESRQVKKIKRLPHEKHAEVGQRAFSKERGAALPHDVLLLDEARKSKDGGHEKSLWSSERFRDEPKDEYIYSDVSKSVKAAALLAALNSKQKEICSSGSKSVKLPHQSGSAHDENLRVTSRTVHSDDDKNDEPYIESRKMILPSKSDIRNVSQSPVFRKSQSPDMKVPRKRQASPFPCPVSKEKEDRVLNEKRSFTVLQAFLKTSFEKNGPEFCQALGLNVDSCDKLPLLQTLLGGLNSVGGLPADGSARSTAMNDHFDRDSVSKSQDRQTLISPDERTSRSPGRSRSPERRKAGLPDMPVSRAPGRPKSRSPDKRKSTSLDRRLSRSPDRRSSRLPDKQMSGSPVRRKSSLPGRRASKSPDRRKSVSPSRRRSRSPDRHRSRSSDRRRSKSPDRRRSRSPDRRRSRSPDSHRSRSLDRRRSRSSDRHRSRSSDRRRSRSPDRRRSRSPHRRRSKSPGKSGSRSPKRPRARSVERSKSRSPHRLKARSPTWTRPRSPARYKSKSPGRHRSQSTSRPRSSSPGQRRIRSSSVLPSQAVPPPNQQVLPAGPQNLVPQVQTSHAVTPNQQVLPAGQQNLIPQVQKLHTIPPPNQQILSTGPQNLAPQVQTSYAVPPPNQQMLPTGQQCLPPQVQTFNSMPPVNQQMWTAGQQCLPPQVQTFNSMPPVNQQMLPTGQQCLPSQVQTFNATPPVNQQMWTAGQQNIVPQTPQAISSFNQQMWPARQQYFDPQVQTFPPHRTAAPNWAVTAKNWPAEQNWQLPQYQGQNVYRDTNTTIINTYNMSILPVQEEIPAVYQEDYEELPDAESRELSKDEKEEPPKEQPTEQVQELPDAQEKEPENVHEQPQNQDPSKSATKNDTNLEVDIFGEFPVYERRIIFRKMAQMNTAERQKLAQDLSQTQTRLATLKADMANLVKEQNEIMHRTGVVDANLSQLTENKKAQANLTEEVRSLLKASNYVPVKAQVVGERQFKIPKLNNQQFKKQKLLGTGNFKTGFPKPWLNKREDTLGKTGSQAYQDQEDYEYYDNGNHWCPHCSLSFYSAQQMLFHIGTLTHRNNFEGNTQPWKSTELRQTTAKVGFAKRKIGKRQIKGADMMCSVLGIYCKVCQEFCGHITDALRHMKTDSHYDKYMKFVKDSEREESFEKEKHGSDDQTPSGQQRSSRGRMALQDPGVEGAVKKEQTEQDSALLDQKPFPDLVETECDFLDIPMPDEFPQLDIPMSEEGEIDTKPILTYTMKSPLQVNEEKRRLGVHDDALVRRPSVAPIPDHGRKVISSGQADDRKKIKSSSSQAGHSQRDKSMTDSAIERKKNRKKKSSFIIEDSSEDEKDVLLGDTPTPTKRAKLSATATAGQDKTKVTPKTAKSSTAKVSDTSASKSSTSSASKSTTSATAKSSSSAAKKVFTSAASNSSTPASSKVSTATADSQIKTKVSTATADSQVKMKKVSSTPAASHDKVKVHTPTTTKDTSLTTSATAKVSSSSASKVSSSSASKVSSSSTSKVSTSSASKVSSSSASKVSSSSASKVSTSSAASSKISNVSTSASSSKKKAEASTATSSSKIKTEASTEIKKSKVADVLVVDSKESKTAIEEIRVVGIGNKDHEQGGIDSLSEDSCDVVIKQEINSNNSGTDSREEHNSSDNESRHVDIKQNKVQARNENVQTKTSVKSAVSKSRKKQKSVKYFSSEEDSLGDLSSDSDDDLDTTAVASRGHEQGKKSKNGQDRKPAAISEVKVVLEMLKLSQPTVKCGDGTNIKKLSSSSSSPSVLSLSGANPEAKKPKKASFKKTKVKRNATIDLTRLPVVKLRRLTDREIAFYVRPAAKAAKKSSLYRPRPSVREESLDSDTTVADETEDCPATLWPAGGGDEQCEAKGSIPNDALQSSNGKDIPVSVVAGDKEGADSCEVKEPLPDDVQQSSQWKDILLSAIAGDKEDADSCEVKEPLPDDVQQSSQGKDIPLSAVAGDKEHADSCEVKEPLPDDVQQSSQWKDILLSAVAGDKEDADSCEVKEPLPNSVLQSSQGKDTKLAAVSEQGHTEGGSSD